MLKVTLLLCVACAALCGAVVEPGGGLKLAPTFRTGSNGLLDATLAASNDGETLFRMQMASSTPVFLHGRQFRQGQDQDALIPSGQKHSTGRDSFGKYIEQTLMWETRGHTDQNVRMWTSVRSYPDLPRVLTFRVEWPEGASQTNTGKRELPIMAFPSVDLNSVENLGYAAWRGLWPDPYVGMNLTAFPPGPNYQDGPVVFTSDKRFSILFGPISDPLNTVHSIDQTENALVFGTSSIVESLPIGHSMSVVAVLGKGMHDTMKKYGELVLLSAKPSGPKLEDPTLEYLSAWTDNGAYYFWDSTGQKVLPKPAKVLPGWLSNLRENGVNVTTLQLDGWWMSQLHGRANEKLWPNQDWTAFLSSINSNQGTALLLYKAFFAKNYSTFASTNCSSVQSPTGVFYPAPDCAERFYRAVFASFKQSATSSGSDSSAFAAFETDFLSDHLLPTPGIASHYNGLNAYFQGLAKAAQSAGVATQLCMPTAGIVLASAAWPAMTNGRVSTDYATESSPGSTWDKTYNIGIGSLLFWAVGLAPSKDITWTVPHQPGGACDHDNPNVELDMALAVLSCGPVGIADGINYTNFTLARMSASKDGRILKPSKPLTALDSTFVPGKPHYAGRVGFLPLMQGATGCDTPVKLPGSAPQCSPAAEQTHMTIPISLGSLAGDTRSAATWRILLTIHLGDFRPVESDLLPQASSSGIHLVAYRELRWSRCKNGTKAFGSNCLLQLSDNKLPNIRSGEEFRQQSPLVPWRMFTLYPLLPILSRNGEKTDDGVGWILLGEVDKIVGVSPLRFTSILVEASCLTIHMHVATGETVTIGLVTPDGIYREETFGESTAKICSI